MNFITYGNRKFATMSTIALVYLAFFSIISIVFYKQFTGSSSLFFFYQGIVMFYPIYTIREMYKTTSMFYYANHELQRLADKLFDVLGKEMALEFLNEENKND